MMSNHFDQLAQTWDQDQMKVERSKATAEQCRNVTLHENKNLLDVGGGTGLLSVHLRDCFESITIADMSKEMLRVAQEKIDRAKITNIKTFAVKEDISEVPDTYSAMITLMTLHHIADLEGFISSAAKILDDYGTLMIADIYQDDGSFHDHVADFDGHDGFEVGALSKILENANFEVSSVNPYFEITKETQTGEMRSYPLFFLVARKR